MNDVASRITSARSAAGLSMGQTARLLGCSTTWISAVESGKKTPNRAFLHRLAEYCSVSADWLETGREADVPADIEAQMHKLTPEAADAVRALIRILPKGGEK